jgi:uncharacterized peroxidase-related enzyme
MECQMLQEEQATGKTKALYEEIKASMGMVPNFFKAQAAVDGDWAATNWKRVQQILLQEGHLDRKTKEIIAMVVSILNHCQYCHVTHKAMAQMAGATPAELNEAVKVIELFQSFTAIADSLQVPCDF